MRAHLLRSARYGLVGIVAIFGTACGAAIGPGYARATSPAALNGSAPVVLETLPPSPTPDYAAIRLEMGALAREESASLDPEVAARWSAFIGGQNESYRSLDERVIRALRTDQTDDGLTVYPIGGALLTGVEQWGAQRLDAVGYMVFDQQTGDPTVIGWLDDFTGDVIEASTGYRLNVRDHPGEWIDTGPGGEQFYRYGFSYYRPWRRILPDPIITLANAFYSDGAQHVWRYLADYQQAADEYDQGDMTLIAWDSGTPDRVVAWMPSDGAAPTLILPDSGTVDVRRERFLEAVTSGQVKVDRESVWNFMDSDRWENGYRYAPEVTDQQIVDALLTPYRSGHLFSDLEAAIILAATYGGDDPLTIHISARLEDGAGVPRGPGNNVYIAAGEVADVILGYPGTMNSRWAHEMAHVLEFRDTRNPVPVRGRGQPSACEPLKYMLEYMWWVERYPHDAPDWDWMPVGSGLTLARLLTGTYPNSGC